MEPLYIQRLSDFFDFPVQPVEVDPGVWSVDTEEGTAVIIIDDNEDILIAEEGVIWRI